MFSAMNDRSSLEVLLTTNQSERHTYLAHFDSLDTKAGIALGSAGVLIALEGGSQSVLSVFSILSAAVAAVAAVGAFWPREFPSIDPTRLGHYAASELAFTQLTLLDTLEVMLIQTRSVLRQKSLRLKVALISLTASAVLTAADLIRSQAGQ